MVNQTSISQQNNIQAGGNVNLTSTEGNIHLQNTQVKAQDQINLDSAQNILLESGQSTNKADGKNSNAGLSVGYGVSVGAQTGAYIYAEAGYGKGSNHLDSTSQSNTTLDANQINIKSKADTTLSGAQATANRIDADVGGKLSIISQQDSIEQNSKQLGVGGRVQASLGTAWQIDAEGMVWNTELARQFKEKFNLTDEQATYLVSVASGIGIGGKIGKAKVSANVDKRLPVSTPTVADNGLTYLSNPKHTLGGAGNRPNVGIEPKNSLELFNKSVPIGGNSNKRFTLDSSGNIHQFTYEGTGSNTYHWAGSTGDSRNPLILDNKTKSSLRKMGWTSKVLK